MRHRNEHWRNWLSHFKEQTVIKWTRSAISSFSMWAGHHNSNLNCTCTCRCLPRTQDSNQCLWSAELKLDWAAALPVVSCLLCTKHTNNAENICLCEDQLEFYIFICSTLTLHVECRNALLGHTCVPCDRQVQLMSDGFRSKCPTVNWEKQCLYAAALSCRNRKETNTNSWHKHGGQSLSNMSLQL